MGEKFFWGEATITFAPPPFEEPKGGYLVLDYSPFLLFLDISQSSREYQRLAHTAVVLSSARKKAWELCFFFFFIDFISPGVFLLSELTLHS